MACCQFSRHVGHFGVLKLQLFVRNCSRMLIGFVKVVCVLEIRENICVGGTLRFGEAFRSSKIGSCVTKIFILFSVRAFELRCENCTRNKRKRLYRWPAAILGGILSHSGAPAMAPAISIIGHFGQKSKFEPFGMSGRLL